MALRLLHTNDLHGQLKKPLLPALASAREEADLYLDSGDCIKSGNLSIPFKEEKAWKRLDQVGCDISCLGNRETHIMPSPFKLKIQGARHPIICGNLRDRVGGRPLPGHHAFKVHGLRVAVFSVMVAMVTERMATQKASSYLWDPPIETARRLVGELRADADCLIALTHIGLTQDRLLADACPEIDLILGGHSHDVLEQAEVVSGVPICSTGSHARYFGVYEWSPDAGLTSYELVPWKTAVAPDS